VPAPSADEVRRGADEILSRPEFQEPAKTLYQRALDWLGARLADALSALLGGGTGAVVAWILLLLVVGAVVALGARAVQRDRRVRRDVGAAVDVDVAERRAPAAREAEADRYEAAGRWRDALRCRYRAVVAGLAGAGVVEELPGRTAGEYRALVSRARPAAAEPFAGATDLFERAWYGGEDTGPDDTATFRDLAARVEAGVASGGAA
jgi:hypothetical protein